MSKFEQTLEKHGYTVQTVSIGLKKSIKEYKDAEKELNAMKADFESADDESKKELHAEIEEFVNLLEETDQDLCKKIEDYIEKKPYYDAKVQHMKDKKAGKGVGTPPKKSSFVGASTTGNVSASLGQTPATGGAATFTATFTQPAVEPAEEPKKKDSWVLWGFLGLVGILVGVNVMKNRE